MVEKHFNISIAPVRSRGGSLVTDKCWRLAGLMITFSIERVFKIILEISTNTKRDHELRTEKYQRSRWMYIKERRKHVKEMDAIF
jgi:hypothetical protein